MIEESNATTDETSTTTADKTEAATDSATSSQTKKADVMLPLAAFWQTFLPTATSKVSSVLVVTFRHLLLFLRAAATS